MKKNIFFFIIIIFSLSKAQNYSNVANYAVRGTPVNGIKIKTNLPYSAFQMPTIILEGYAYGAGQTMGLIINYYIYQNNFYSPSSQVTSFGVYKPKVILAQENGKVVIFLDDKVNYMRFSIRASGNEDPTYYSNWTVVDEPLTGQNQLVLSYKSMPTSFESEVSTKSFLSSSIQSNEGGRLSLFNPAKTGDQADNWSIYNMTGHYGNSLQFWNYTPSGRYGAKLIISDAGNMSLLQGKFEAKEVKVTATPTADFVFEEDYKLPTLEEVERHIKAKKHLPEIASAKEMEKEGVNVGEFQIKLLQKIEELTLYQIELNKKIKYLEKENLELKQTLNKKYE